MPYSLKQAEWAQAAARALQNLYGAQGERTLHAALALAEHARRTRPQALLALDAERLAAPDWFLGNDRIGYTAYVDRFGGDLQGVARRIPYLQELGVRYLHLLPFLKMRPGRNDGGFAVSNYGAVEPALGSMEDLEALATCLRAAGVSLCADLLLNHTADDHPWALAAKAGDPRYRAYYHVLSDRAAVAAWEANLPQVFAETAPGNFTYAPELDGFVWTTFYPYQWDLNWANPEVFLEMLAAAIRLANAGVEVFRLDSAPFLWKRLGTDCRNLPETHTIIQALRALLALAAPAVALKAEAIVPSDRLLDYLGAEPGAPECHLAYHTTLMTLQWAALAEGRAERLARVLAGMRAPPPGAGWLTYVRCHDDIGWSVLQEERAGYPAEDWGALVRRLGAFYAGGASFAAGVAFQTLPGAVPHGVSGTLASLCGLERAAANGDAGEIDLAIARILLMFAVSFGFGGIPLINMGDELGQLNDRDYAQGPRFDGDNRWLHRGLFDEAAAARRHAPDAVEAQLFEGVRRLAQARRLTPAALAAPPSVSADPAAVLRLARPGMLLLANFSGQPAPTTTPPGRWRDLLRETPPTEGEVVLSPYQAAWLVAEED